MLSEFQKQLVRHLQEDFPEGPEPYREIAERLGVPEEQVLEGVRTLLAGGQIKRMGAVLAHRRMGLSINPMIVMEVSPEDIPALGERIAAFPEVTHCYHRPRMEGFPYDVFAMIHCKTQEEADRLVEKITDDSRIRSYQLLYSTREYKKTSMKYFQK